MQLPRSIAVFNKYVTNHVQRLWAGVVPPWAIVVHTGRLSGREYRTPVVGFQTPKGFAIPAYYGVRSQWVQNLLAAGGGEIRRRGKRYELLDPRVIASTDVGARGFAGLYIRGAESSVVATLRSRS